MIRLPTATNINGDTMKRRKILILGASYGSLLGIKLAAAGHDVTLICLPNEVEAINASGTIVRMPVKGQNGLVEINSRDLAGSLGAAGPAEVVPSDFDIVALAMQEPQYRVPAIKALMSEIGKARVPVMSIMNMPPLTFLKRIPGVDDAKLRHCYADPNVWDLLDPQQITLCSPDPQAFRPPTEPINVLQVRLPTNFKAACFTWPADNALLDELADGISAYRHRVGTDVIDLPVKLRVHDSIFVPLAKWSMLLAGNYRCVEPDRVVSIRTAVHTDLAQSRRIYEDVQQVCISLGAAPDDLVPFDKYAAAAEMLESPSSVARALAAGATAVERVDLLVQALAEHVGRPSADISRTVANVDGWIARNRTAAAG
mgnify:CR=1 FL=1